MGPLRPKFLLFLHCVHLDHFVLPVHEDPECPFLLASLTKKQIRIIYSQMLLNKTLFDQDELLAVFIRVNVHVKLYSDSD